VCLGVENRDCYLQYRRKYFPQKVWNAGIDYLAQVR